MNDERILVSRIRLAVVGLLALFLLGGAFTRIPNDPMLSAVGIAVALPAAAVASARRPRLAVALSLLAGIGVVLDAGGSHSSLGYFGLCALALLCVLIAGPRRGAVFTIAALALLGERLVSSSFDVGWLPWIGGVAVSAVGAAVIVHEQRLLAQLRIAQADLAARSRAEERARIARDVHDVIAHSLTVSLMHITGARLAVEHDPAGAARALAEAERLGRESLDEVRSIVGLLRTGADADSSALTPTPGIARLDELVERFRAAGAEISLERGKELEQVPATVGATAYRIAQEALTNAAKHAPGSTVLVRVATPGGRLELSVESDGPPAGGRGHGLQTMRERAEAVGGTVIVGPAELAGGTGWQVRASLPSPGAGGGT